MYVDVLGRVSNAQAFGAGAVSTSSVDLGNVTPKREIGTGEPVGFGFCVTTSATVAPTTVSIIQSDADTLAAPDVLASATIPLATAVAGYAVFIAFPPGTPTKRYVGIQTATAGGTISGTAWLTAWDLFSIPAKAYAKGYKVT